MSFLADPEFGHVRRGTSPWEAVWIVIVADVVMNLDKVLAVAGAAHGTHVLVAFGIAFSLPVVLWGSGLLRAVAHRLHRPLPVGQGLILTGLGRGFARATRSVSRPG